MLRRTTIEIDDELLTRAKEALGCSTMRATVEEALRQASHRAEDEAERTAGRQRDFLERLPNRIDSDVLLSQQMWR